MAEGVLFDIAGNIISLACGLAAREMRLRFGAEDELQKLTKTILTIRALLLDAEEQQSKNREVSAWLEGLSDILHDADDLLDASYTEALRRQIITKDKKAKKVRIFFSKSNQLAFRLKMGQKIKAINKRLDALKDIRELHLQECLDESQMRFSGRAETHSDVIAKEVVGREDDKMNVIENLMGINDEENVSILPIVGIGGLGKTTLAKLVFNDERIQKHFELKMWVYVSEPFYVKDIIEKILESSNKVKPEPAELDTQKNKLKEEIVTKKYFLVLDDVWNENGEKWLDLKTVLLSGAKGSRILATTRSKKVANIIFQGEPFYLKGLKENESEDILRQMAFQDGQWPENPRIREVGRVILRKCAGVPLAVKTMGRLLYFKNSEIEWQNFVKNELSNIDQDEFGILPTLKLSYNKLPSHLKQCFAYCSIYPKDHEYDRTTIINEWIAHGFVDSSSTCQCLEDVGNDYFIDLLWRSFLQDPKKNIDHVIIGCKMHDLMHDLATSVMAGSLITMSNKKEWKINEKTHHLSVCENLDFSIKELISQCEKRMVRTFHCPKFRGEIDCEVIFSSFKFLRVLNLSKNNLKHVSNSIGKLKHLRYLDLSQNTKIKVLPCYCTSLVNLQFLNLSYCRALLGLPKGIKNMVNLRHLNLDGCSKMTYFSRGLRKSTSFQWLKKFRIDSNSLSSDNASLSEFKELDNLEGSLTIWNLRHSKDVAIEYKSANIKNKIGLKSLMLHFSSNDEDHDNYVKDERILEGLQPHINLMKLEMNSCRSEKLPSWILSITGLMELRLYKCHKCQYLPLVNQLHFLKELYLCDMNALVFIANSSEFFSSSPASTENSFKLLSKITFVDCPKVKGWWGNSSLNVDSDIRLLLFPMLSELLIKRCSMLTCLPLSPQLCMLKELYLEKMDALEYLFDDDKSPFSSFSSTSIEDFFSSLSKIHFKKCPKLKGWWRDSSLEVDHYDGHYSKRVVITSIKGQCTLPLFPQLLDVWIIDCPMLTSIPLSLQSRLLKEVCLDRIVALEYVFDDDWSNSSICTEAFFPSLSKIRIEHCPNLKGWWRDFSLEVDHILPLFPKLSNVDINDCPLLISLPLSLHIESLWLERCSLKLLQLIMMTKMPSIATNSTLVSSSTPLSKLKVITLKELLNLETLQEEWLKNLTSLKSLRIFYCLKLKSLSLGIQHLTALENLTINNCPELEPPTTERGKCWESLKNLLFLDVENLSKWVSLPMGLQEVSTLQGLGISDCKNLTTILESIHSWKSLKEVRIWCCPHLAELPEGMESLSSLLKLEIEGSSKLKSLSPGIQHLTALKSLIICDCPQLDECGMGWDGLRSLLFLRIVKLSKWVSLPLGLQQVSTLRALYISECESLTTILESIHHWKSLEILGFLNCPCLIELPKGIQSLSSLQKLLIEGCPILLQKYKRDGGVDWPKIAHIPELELDFNSSEESVFDLEFLNMERLCLH